jgi:hypothetical protein
LALLPFGDSAPALPKVEDFELGMIKQGLKVEWEREDEDNSILNLRRKAK